MGHLTLSQQNEASVLILTKPTNCFVTKNSMSILFLCVLFTVILSELVQWISLLNMIRFIQNISKKEEKENASLDTFRQYLF